MSERESIDECSIHEGHRLEHGICSDCEGTDAVVRADERAKVEAEIVAWLREIDAAVNSNGEGRNWSAYELAADIERGEHRAISLGAGRQNTRGTTSSGDPPSSGGAAPRKGGAT